MRVALFIAIVWGLVCDFMIGYTTSRSFCQADSVRHGAAHWEVSVDGSTTFKWNDETKNDQTERPTK